MGRGRSEVYGTIGTKFRLSFVFNYNVGKLTKKHRNACVLYKSMECRKKWFFSVPRRYKPNFVQFLYELHCYRANRLKYTDPLEQN